MNKLDQLFDYFERVIAKFRMNRIAFIIIAVSIATFFQFSFQKLLDDNTPPLLMFVMVPLVTSWFGGFYFGVYSTIFSIFVADYFFYEPLGSILQTPREIGRMIVFFMQGLIISMLSELRNRSNKKLNVAYKKEKKARYESEQAKKSRDDFISIVSHELKNPINNQLAFLHILKKLAERDKSNEYVKHLLQVEHQTIRMSRLISDLLSVSKLQVNKLQLEKEMIDMSEITDIVVEEFKTGGVKHEIIVKGKTNSLINADKQRIIQVITNLMTNAIKYSPDNRKITISLMDNKKHTFLSVKDHGEGISKNNQKKLFSKYYRVHNSEKKYNGLGMGLYIVDEIVKLHGGSVSVKSEKGKGSTFTIKLPVAKS